MFLSANADARPKNVILFGQTGVGKSSIVNLLVGRDVANISSGLKGCTLEATEYSFTFPGPMKISIMDTVGLEEPEIGINTFFGAITKAHQLIKALVRNGGVDLLVFCIHAGRVTTTTQQNYRLFFDFLCAGKVPVAIVVTNLEHEASMEDWWTRNKTTFDKYDIRSVAHACITALPASVPAYAHKRAESKKALRMMLIDALGNNANGPYVREEESWFGAFVKKVFHWKSPKKELSSRLETECGLPHDYADKLAQMLVSSK